jgi:hypothetical protein
MQPTQTGHSRLLLGTLVTMRFSNPLCWPGFKLHKDKEHFVVCTVVGTWGYDSMGRIVHSYGAQPKASTGNGYLLLTADVHRPIRWAWWADKLVAV